MKIKSLIMTILLLLIVILSSNSAFAENITDLNDNILQESDNIETISQSDELIISQSDEANPIIANGTSEPKIETVSAGSDNTAIQEKIDGLSDGDTLNFENGTYTDICLVVNKSITINGNGAVLVGYDTPSKTNTPQIIYSPTSENGYGISNFATLFIVNTHDVVLNGLTFIGGGNSGTNIVDALVYVKNTKNILIDNNIFDGSCTGVYLVQSHDGIISNNNIKNQASTGILNFQSARTLIENNTITNAKNHGIDVRHNIGPNAKVINNTVIGSKEGIYLMHSSGHIAANNTLINCTISSISCYGSWNINIYNNKLKQSRIGVLLGGEYKNIIIGENDYQLYDLPLPPIFAYYVAQARQDYQSAENIMGTYTDLIKSNVTYSEFREIASPGEIVVDYDKILNQTGTVRYVTAGMTSSDIQSIIDDMADGDTLSFEANANFYDICIYINKNIKVIGNNATLYGYNNSKPNNVPEKVRNTTANNGYGISQKAIIYSIWNSNVVISDLNIISRYPDHGLVTAQTGNPNYQTAGIYAQKCENITITNCRVDGASFGIFLHFQTGVAGCSNAIITNNYVSNQFTYGILNFGCKNSLIANNTVENARYHGIDVRHNFGPNVTVFNNTIIGSQEGIYLMHSKGHKVYENSVKNAKVSSISAYGSGNEYIFNNTLQGSRIGIIIGGEHYNVTIGPNTYILDAQKSGDKPGFGIYIAESKQNDDMGVYTDQKQVSVEATTDLGYEKTTEITLTDENGVPVANRDGTITIGNDTFTFKTNANGIASVKLDVPVGYYENVIIKTTSNYDYTSGYLLTSINITDDRVATSIVAPAKAFYLETIAKGSSYQITLKDVNGKVISGKQIVVTFNGKTLKATTNAKGIATVKLTSAATGIKKATIKFAGDNDYYAFKKTATIKITKEASKLTSQAKSFYLKSTKKVTAILKTKSGKAIVKGKVTLRVNCKNYIAYTNSKGVATFNVKIAKKGAFATIVKFAGDKYHTAISAKSRILIR